MAIANNDIFLSTKNILVIYFNSSVSLLFLMVMRNTTTNCKLFDAFRLKLSSYRAFHTLLQASF